MTSNEKELNMPVPHVEDAEGGDDFIDGSAGTKPQLRFLCFFLGSELFGIETEKIAEVIDPLSVTTIPLAPPFVNGIAAHRGEIISLLNPKNLFKDSSSPIDGKKKWVVFNVNAGETQFAFPVDRIHEIMSFKVSGLRKTEAGSPVPMLGAVETASGTCNLMDISRLLSSLAVQ
ncbi:MAG: chemotaxis protein CheW [Blastocatellia bacterium]